MTRDEKIEKLTEVLSAGKIFTQQAKERIEEKTDEQLDYILSPIDQCIYLEACAGSGKTEVLGLKAAYEICRWGSRQTGIAVLTFTNEATATIADRVSSFYGKPVPSNHFIGTFSSFVHGHIAQRFGYKFYHIPEDRTDKSFRVVDSDISPYSNQWLENYKLNFPFPKQKIYASQLYYKASCKDWFIGQGESAKSLTELYNSSECQQHIAEIRQRKNAFYLFQLNYLKDQIKECKLKFWHDGFANFDDMNLIAHECLRNETICRYIARKFPVILVDECQDLSASELGTLSLLISAGMVVHYIGDLHQAIYSFKDACPEQYKAHIEAHRFKTKYLSANFRSTQKIVDFSRKMGGIDYPISGSVESKCSDYDCCYVEYDDDEKDAIIAFIDTLNRLDIPIKDAVVLVRTQSAKQKLSYGPSNDHKTHPIINAIQLWQQNEPVERQTALSLLAYQLQRWMGFHGKSNNYYYSDEVCPNAVSWRLLLRDILVELCSDPAMTTVDKLTYGSWYSKNKVRVISVIAHHLNTIGKNLPEITIRTPNGTAKLPIYPVKLTEEKQLRIETIHSVKGGTFDAVLLLSSPDGRGKTGFWEKWLNSEDESGRIGYVASTRPRYLLCWGVKRLTDVQRRELEKLGLVNLNSDKS